MEMQYCGKSAPEARDEMRCVPTTLVVVGMKRTAHSLHDLLDVRCELAQIKQNLSMSNEQWMSVLEQGRSTAGGMLTDNPKTNPVLRHSHWYFGVLVMAM